MKTPDLATFKRWAKDCAPAARAVLLARVFAELERERVSVYVQPIFEGYRFQYPEEDGRSGLSGPMTNPEHLYMVPDLHDPLVLAFYADCEEAHRAHGFKGKPGHCPALEAETLRRVAEGLLIDLAEPLFGLENGQLYGDNRARYLESLIGACLKEVR